MRDASEQEPPVLLHSPEPRPFRLRGLLVLTALYFAGNLLSIPQLIAQGTPIPSPAMMLLFTAFALVFAAAGQFFANRVGIGAPLIFGHLRGRDALTWASRAILTAVLFSVLASPILVGYNRHVALGAATQPELWRLVLASIDAGVQEELFSRYFLMSLFVWLGWRLQGASRTAPNATVYWVAILLSASFFAWDHVEGHLADLSQARIVEVLTFTGALGVGFGWCFWKFGLECAILAHILVDAVGMVLVNAVYFPANSFVLPITIGALILAGVSSARVVAGTW